MTVEAEVDILPSSWVHTTLSDIRRDTTSSLNPKKHEKETFELYSVPQYESGEPEVVVGAEIGSTKRLVEPKTVLVCKINPHINRVWVVGDKTPHRKIASTEWIPFTEDERFIPGFLRYYLQQSAFRDYLSSNVSGVGGSLMRVNQKTIEAYAFPLPPLAEQHRIVEKIEELFTKLEAGVDALKKTQTLLGKYRQAVLKAAVTGELSREWREQHLDVEPASELLERTQNTKSQSAESSDVAELPELPKTWAWAVPEQLASSSKYALAIGPFGSNLKVSDYRDEGTPLVFVRNIRSNNFSDENAKYVSPKKAKELTSHEVEGGDILITKMGEPPGDACLYPLSRPKGIITADCIKWRVSKAVSDANLYVHFTNSSLIRTQFISITQGVAQKKVSLGRFKSIKYPVPPAAEQKYILNEVERLFSNLDNLEMHIAHEVPRAERLRQAILKQAFTGRLVPQNPDDEPASELLARLKNGAAGDKKPGKWPEPRHSGDTAQQEGLFGD